MPDFGQKEERGSIGRDEAWFANVKRTYDEYQQESLEAIREMRTHFTKILSDAQQHDNTRQTITNQALQNAVETANMVSKRAMDAHDLAIDRQWNLDEVAELATIVATVMTKVLAEMAKDKE